MTKRSWVEVGAGRWMLVDDEPKSTAPNQAPFVKPEHLSPEARRSLRLQLGRDFDSASALRAYMKDNDLRFIDRGDRQDVGRRRMAELFRDTKPGDPLRLHPPWVKKRRRRA